MNKFEIYLWIDGDRFDANRFNSAIAKDLAGKVRPYKRVMGREVGKAGMYWKSKIISPAEDCVEEKLLALLLKFKSEISRAKEFGADRIFAQIAAYMGDIDHLRGYYLSKEILRVLVELDMELDIDIVRQLKKGG